MATGNSSQMDLNCLLLWQGEPARGAMPIPSPPPPPTTSCGDVMTHLSSRGPLPDAPEAAHAVNVPLASLISLTDDSSVLTDSCPSGTLSEAGVTRVPTQAQARHAGAECRVLNGCTARVEGGAGVEVAGGEPPHPSLVLKKAEWGAGGLRPTSQPTTQVASPQQLPSVPLKASSPAGTQDHVPLTSSGAAAPPNESKSDASRLPSKPGGDKKQGDLALAGMNSRAYASKACSPACAENYEKLYLQVTETKHQLSTLTVKMEEQASHISKLMEENRRYIRESGKLKKNRPRESHGLHTDGYEDPSGYGQADCPLELEDRVISLQLQNNELNLSLAREKRKRREAEARLERDESYIKRLEDSVQVLRGTRVVMDPSTYRQVAEAYMATRRTPARRPHTHTGVPGSDLVCDSSVDSSLNHQRLSHPSLLETSSCPHSSSSSASSSPQYCPFLPSQESQLCSGDHPISRSRNGKTKKDRGHNMQDMGRGLAVPANTMNPWDYQQLLESLEDLDGASRGALS